MIRRTGVVLMVVVGFATGCGSAGADSGTDEGAVEVLETDDVLTAGGRFDIAEVQGKWVFNLKSRNNQTVLQSGRYENRANAEKGIRSVLLNVFDDARIELRADNSFVVKARNGQEVARSEQYASESNRNRGLATVRRVIAGYGEQDADSPTTGTGPLTLGFNSLVAVPAEDGTFRLRLVDKDGKLHLRMPAGKRLAATELEEWSFALEGLTLLQHDENGFPNEGGLDYVQIERGARGFFFRVCDFKRDRAGLMQRRILMTSPKTDYPTQEAATSAAKAAFDVLLQSPMG